jgi:hypothetical protein
MDVSVTVPEWFLQATAWPVWLALAIVAGAVTVIVVKWRQRKASNT